MGGNTTVFENSRPPPRKRDWHSNGYQSVEIGQPPMCPGKNTLVICANRCDASTANKSCMIGRWRIAYVRSQCEIVKITCNKRRLSVFKYNFISTQPQRLTCSSSTQRFQFIRNTHQPLSKHIRPTARLWKTKSCIFEKPNWWSSRLTRHQRCLATDSHIVW